MSIGAPTLKSTHVVLEWCAPSVVFNYCKEKNETFTTVTIRTENLELNNRFVSGVAVVQS